MAKSDLARHLKADLSLIQLVAVAVREPNTEDMSCLAENSYPEELWTRLNAVQQITFSVKGNFYHYIALGDFIIYCDK